MEDSFNVNPDLEIRPFKSSDFSAYQQWFLDVDTKRALGDIDEEWLDYILQEENGIELAVLKYKKLVAVVGLVYPDASHPYYTVANMAVHPKYRNQGLGSRILEQLFDNLKLKPEEYWVGYVAPENAPAQHFLEKNGWYSILTDAPQEMIRFEFRST